MKRLVGEAEIEDISGEGLEKLLGEKVLLLCTNYFYHGKLVGVSDSDVLLEDPSIVYETGEWNALAYKDIQRLPTLQWYVRIDAIESYGLGR